MTVVSSKKKYLAPESSLRKVITVEDILEGGYGGYADASEYDRVLEPDEDFYRAISMEELRKRVREDIHQWYKEKDESNSIARGSAIS